MCLIAVKNKGVDLPEKKKLEIGYKNNPDGVGIAMLRPDKNLIYIKKDFKDFEDFWKWSNENISRDDIAVIHFRLATSGKVDIGNRHPFPITRNKQLLRRSTSYSRYIVAHNGVLSDYSYKKGKYSDTQKFTMDLLADLKYKLHIEGVQRLISKYIGSDKLAIIDAKHRKLILIGDYIEDNRIFWSNDNYKESKSRYRDRWDDFLGCDICERELKNVKWIAKESMYLCRRCRKRIRKYGLGKWLDKFYDEKSRESYKNDEDDDYDEIDLTYRRKYNLKRKW